MQIKCLGEKKFEIRSKDIVLLLDGGISVNDFAFPGPGEYEKNGVIINGIADGQNTIFALRLEEINLGYLGLINHDLTEEEAKQIGDIDILFLPLGLEGSADLKTALKLLSKIDPKIVIPMLYSDLSEFKKSEGISDGEIDILKIKKTELPEEERQVIILKAS